MTIIHLLFLVLFQRSHGEPFEKSLALSDAGENLLRHFRKYLMDIEDSEAAILNEKKDGTSSNSDSILPCTTREECSKVIHDFIKYVSPKAQQDFCRFEQRRSELLDIFDTSPYCAYLHTKFDICNDPMAIAMLGCHMTCKKRETCDTEECYCDPKYSKGRYKDQRYECACLDGFQGDGYTCTDINECSTVNECHHNAVCLNTPGSYVCQCNVGFSGDGRHCTDVNECRTGLSKCSKFASCINTPGSYDCACLQGYTGNGYLCKEQGKCSTIESTCSKYATCVEDDNGARCRCHFGFYGNGYVCSGTNGYDFDIMLMSDMDPVPGTTRERSVELLVVTRTKCNILVEYNDKNRRQYKHVRATSGLNVIAITTRYHVTPFRIENSGIRVKSECVIALYFRDSNMKHNDGFQALPRDRLSTRYIVSTSMPDRGQQCIVQIGVLSIHNHTGITFKLNMKNGTIQDTRYTDGIVTIQMNEMQTFVISHQYDLSGTFISSTKPMAVFSGSSCFKDSRQSFTDSVVVMIPPINALDKTFVIPPPSGSQSMSLVRVLAPRDLTMSIHMPGLNESTIRLSSGEYYDIVGTDLTPILVRGTYPLLVTQFSKSANSNGLSDTFSVTLIPGIHEYLSQYSFPVIRSPFAASVIIEKDFEQDLLLNGDGLNYEDHFIIDDFWKTYKVMQIHLLDKSIHTLVHGRKRFGFIKL